MSGYKGGRAKPARKMKGGKRAKGASKKAKGASNAGTRKPSRPGYSH